MKGTKIKIKIDINNAITPPNLLGIDRRIAYANKKYHSCLLYTSFSLFAIITSIIVQPLFRKSQYKICNYSCLLYTSD